MNNKYKKFLTVGLISVAIGLGATVSPDAEAITMPPVRVSTVATNVAISSSHNAANIAIANSKNSQNESNKNIMPILGGLLATLVVSIGWVVIDGTKLDKDIKKRISNVRDKLFNSSAKSENKHTL